MNTTLDGTHRIKYKDTKLVIENSNYFLHLLVDITITLGHGGVIN